MTTMRGALVDETEKAMQAWLHEAALTTAALTVLLDRAGGTLEYSEEEYEAIAARYGGASLAIHLDIVDTTGRPRSFRATIIRKTPANAELRS